MSTEEEGSYRGQTGKTWPSRAGSEEEEEEDGSEEEGKQQLCKVGVPLACSLLPLSPGSWSQTSDVLCCVHVYQGVVGQRRLGGNREMTLNNAESLMRKSPSRPPHLPITHTHGESLFPAFPVSLTPH